MVHSTWGILIAGGKGEQLSPEVSTPFLYLNGSPLIIYSLNAFEKCPDIDGVVVMVDKDRVEGVVGMARMFGCSKVRKVLPGTNQRSQSILSILKGLDEEVTLITLHDASRPCVTPDIISETIKTAKRYGNGVAAVEVGDYVKAVDKGLTVSRSIEEQTLWAVQTPQTYRRELLLKGYDFLLKKKIVVDDDSLALEKIKEEIHLVESKRSNIKIRTPEDLNLAAAFLRA